MKHKNWKRFRKSPYLPITLLAVASLVLGILTWQVGHTPRSDVARQITSSASGCVPVLTQDESHTLLMNLSRINQDYFSGRSSEEKRDLNLTELFRQLNPEQSTKRAGWINAEVALINDMAVSDFVAYLTHKRISGESISDREQTLLTELQVTDPEGYVDDNVLRTEPYVDTLRTHGARYDVEHGTWDLSRFKLNAITLLTDQPEVYLALATLFSPVLAASLRDTQRREALIHDQWVFFPPIKSGSQGTLPEGEIAIWSLTKYQEAVKRDLEFFSATLKNFLLASEQMTTFSHIFRGIGQEGLYRYITPNLKIAGSDMTGEELAYVTYREHLSGTAYRLIFDYGVPGELKDKLFETIDQASNIDDQNRHTQIEKIKLIRKAVIALAALPVVVYFAPAAGGLISAKMATFVGTTSAVMALMPMAFGAGLAVVNASIYQQRYGGDWFCHFAEEMTEKGLGSFYMAPYMAAIPVGAALAAAAPMAGAAAVDSLAGTLVGAYAAPVIYGGLNIGVALYFVQDMGRHGYTGLSDCHGKIQKMHELAQEHGASLEHLNMLLTEGMAQCAQGGFDIAFALTGGTTLAARGYKGAKHIYKEGQTRKTIAEEVRAQQEYQRDRQERMAKAKQILMRDLTPAQQEAVQRAHEVGSGQPGRSGGPAAIDNYTDAQLREKSRILDEAGFSTAERRKLIEEGVVGEAAAGASQPAWTRIDDVLMHANIKFPENGALAAEFRGQTWKVVKIKGDEVVLWRDGISRSLMKNLVDTVGFEVIGADFHPGSQMWWKNFPPGTRIQWRDRPLVADDLRGDAWIIESINADAVVLTRNGVQVELKTKVFELLGGEVFYPSKAASAIPPPETGGFNPSARNTETKPDFLSVVENAAHQRQSLRDQYFERNSRLTAIASELEVWRTEYKQTWVFQIFKRRGLNQRIQLLEQERQSLYEQYSHLTEALYTLSKNIEQAIPESALEILRKVREKGDFVINAADGSYRYTGAPFSSQFTIESMIKNIETHNYPDWIFSSMGAALIVLRKSSFYEGRGPRRDSFGGLKITYDLLVIPRDELPRLFQTGSQGQAPPASSGESQGAGPQQEPRSVAENAPDMQLRQRVSANKFRKSRDLLEYAKTFGPRFLSHLARLRGSDHWIDSGAGLAVATRFYAELRPGLTEEAFVVKKKTQDKF